MIRAIWIFLNLMACQDEIFDCQKFLNDLKNSPYHLESKSNDFISHLRKGELKKAEIVYPEFRKLDVRKSLTTIGKETYLSGLSNSFIDPYLDDSYKLLNVTIYLRQKYRTKNSLYDNMLRGCLRLDSTNYAAIYFLAEHRYVNGFEKKDASFLVSRLMEMDPQNMEIRRLSKLLNVKTVQRKMSLKKFLEMNVLFLEE